MRGSIFHQKDRGKWAVSWYHNGRPYTITRYRGEFMYHPDLAKKCLALIQGRWEDHLVGDCQFRIEEFTGKGWTDVLEYYQEWMREVVEPTLKPSTIQNYWSYYHTWIKPFFKKHPVRLHEVQLDTLTKLVNGIDRSPSLKRNILGAFRGMMDYAWRAKRIREMPAFPQIDVPKPEFKWLLEDDQMKVINAIPEIHRPIFLWLKYHYRRPGEACALRKVDFDAINNAFWVRQTVSERQVVNTTKTGEAHYIPCYSEFTPMARRLFNRNPWSPYLFTNPRAVNGGKRYTLKSLNKIWKKACVKVGVEIGLYQGTKHSSCTQFIEAGGSDNELQMLTDHASMQSVIRYRKVSLNRKRQLMERRTNYYKTTTGAK